MADGKIFWIGLVTVVCVVLSVTSGVPVVSRNRRTVQDLPNSRDRIRHDDVPNSEQDLSIGGVDDTPVLDVDTAAVADPVTSDDDPDQSLVHQQQAFETDHRSGDDPQESETVFDPDAVNADGTLGDATDTQNVLDTDEGVDSDSNGRINFGDNGGNLEQRNGELEGVEPDPGTDGQQGENEHGQSGSLQQDGTVGRRDLDEFGEHNGTFQSHFLLTEHEGNANKGTSENSSVGLDSHSRPVSGSEIITGVHPNEQHHGMNQEHTHEPIPIEQITTPRNFNRQQPDARVTMVASTRILDNAHGVHGVENTHDDGTAHGENINHSGDGELIHEQGGGSGEQPLTGSEHVAGGGLNHVINEGSGSHSEGEGHGGIAIDKNDGSRPNRGGSSDEHSPSSTINPISEPYTPRLAILPTPAQTGNSETQNSSLQNTTPHSISEGQGEGHSNGDNPSEGNTGDGPTGNHPERPGEGHVISGEGHIGTGEVVHEGSGHDGIVEGSGTNEETDENKKNNGDKIGSLVSSTSLVPDFPLPTIIPVHNPESTRTSQSTLFPSSSSLFPISSQLFSKVQSSQGLSSTQTATQSTATQTLSLSSSFPTEAPYTTDYEWETPHVFETDTLPYSLYEVESSKSGELFAESSEIPQVHTVQVSKSSSVALETSLSKSSSAVLETSLPLPGVPVYVSTAAHSSVKATLASESAYTEELIIPTRSFVAPSLASPSDTTVIEPESSTARTSPSEAVPSSRSLITPSSVSQSTSSSRTTERMPTPFPEPAQSSAGSNTSGQPTTSGFPTRSTNLVTTSSRGTTPNTEELRTTVVSPGQEVPTTAGSTTTTDRTGQTSSTTDRTGQTSSTTNRTGQTSSTTNRTGQTSSTTNRTGQTSSTTDRTGQTSSTTNRTGQTSSTTNRTGQTSSTTNRTRQTSSTTNRTRQTSSTTNRTGQTSATTSTTSTTRAAPILTFASTATTRAATTTPPTTDYSAIPMFTTKKRATGKSTEKPEEGTTTQSQTPFWTTRSPVTPAVTFTFLTTSPRHVTSRSQPDATKAQSPDTSTPPPVFIQIKIRMSWREFCDKKPNFIASLQEIIRTEKQVIVRDEQIRIPNLPLQYCTIIAANEQTINSIHVQMYIVDEAGKVDVKLTIDAYTVFRKGFEDTVFKDKILEVHVVNNMPHSDNQPPESVVPRTPQRESGITMVIVIASVGGFCCLILIILQVILIHRRVKAKAKLRSPPRRTNHSNDNVALGAMPKSRPNSGYWNPALEDDEAFAPFEYSHVLNYSTLANFCVDVNAIYEEFQNIPCENSGLTKLFVGEDEKNRFANVLPHSHSRVKLTMRDGDTSDYINASYIKGYRSGTDTYIATQSPLVNTVEDFWRMVWEQRSRIIIMLNPKLPSGRYKQSTCYWPDDETLDSIREYGDYSVSLKKRTIYKDYIECLLEITDLERNLKRDVQHFLLTCWPDAGVPKPLSIVKFVLDTRPHYEDGGAPPIVHCGPGTGRTGTLIAIDICMRMYEARKHVDFLNSVYKMRKDRLGMVQTKEQYALIHQKYKLVSSNLDPDETPSYSTSHLDPMCLQKTLISSI